GIASVAWSSSLTVAGPRVPALAPASKAALISASRAAALFGAGAWARAAGIAIASASHSNASGRKRAANRCSGDIGASHNSDAGGPGICHGAPATDYRRLLEGVWRDCVWGRRRPPALRCGAAAFALGLACRAEAPSGAKAGAGDGNRTHDIQLGKLSFYH